MGGLAANIWAWGGLIGLSALALVLAGPWLLLGWCRGRGTTRILREGIWLYGRLYLTWLRPLAPVSLTLPEGGPFRGPAIIVANHQSFLDIYLLAAQAETNLCLLVRAWPFRRLFFFRPLMRLAGYIETEGTSPEHLWRRGREELEAGASLVCFPEGTRSPDGRLGRFHSGVFQLARQLQVPVAPLIIRGSGRVWPKGAKGFRPGPIQLEMRPSFDPGRFSGPLAHGALRREVRKDFVNSLKADQAH